MVPCNGLASHLGCTPVHFASNLNLVIFIMYHDIYMLFFFTTQCCRILHTDWSEVLDYFSITAPPTAGSVASCFVCLFCYVIVSIVTVYTGACKIDTPCKQMKKDMCNCGLWQNFL